MKRFWQRSYYSRGLILAIALHIVLFLMFIVNFTWNAVANRQAKQHKETVVQATTIDTNKVQKELAKLKKIQTSKQQAAIKHQKQLVEQTKAAKEQRHREEQRLIKLRHQREEAERQSKLAAEVAKKKIAILKQKREKETQRLLELEKKRKLEEQARELAKQKEAQRLAELEKKRNLEEQARQLAQQKETKRLTALEEERKLEEQATLALQERQRRLQEARLNHEIDKYKGLIVQAIGRRWIVPYNVDKKLSSQFRIRLAPDGSVLEVELIKSSGNTVLDRSAQTAIYKASPLPVPLEPDKFELFRTLNLTVKPERVLPG